MAVLAWAWVLVHEFIRVITPSTLVFSHETFSRTRGDTKLNYPSTYVSPEGIKIGHIAWICRQSIQANAHHRNSRPVSLGLIILIFGSFVCVQ